MDPRPFRWGLVGLGNIADSEIAPGISRLTGHELAVVVSRDQEKAARFAASHGAATGTTSFDEMLSSDIDAVYLATPNALHVEQVIAAAAAKKHVLCDKPLATSVPDAERAIEAAKRAGVGLGLMFQTRRFEGMAAAAEHVRNGDLGRVVLAHVEMSAGRFMPKGWRTDPSLAGLGTINNIGVHSIDLLRYLLGAEVTEVSAIVDREVSQIDTAALILLRFDNGTIAYVNANQAVPYPRNDVVLYGSEGRVFGNNLSRPNKRGSLVVTTAAGETETPADTSRGYESTLEAFAQAVTSGQDPSPSGLDGLRSVEVTAAIAQALEEGRVVRLGA